MSLNSNRNRIALALFDEGASLCRALSELMITGVTVDQLGVAGPSSAIHRLAHQLDNLASNEIKILISEMQILRRDDGGEKLVVWRGPLWSTLHFFTDAASEPVAIAPWMDPRLRDELIAHINGGCILLGLRTSSIQQQKACTQLLLQHCRHRVRTYEFPH